MYKLFTILILALSVPVTFADNNVSPAMLSLEVFGCKFNKNRDLDDLLKVANEWDSWADNNFSKPYNALVLTPYAYTASDFAFDMIWLGVTEDHHSMGVVNDEWVAKGGKLQAKFDSDCPSVTHFYATSLAIKPIAEDDAPARLTAWSCQFKEGKGVADLAAADAAWKAHMTEVGIPGSLYRWFPGAGYPRASADDYLQVYVTSSQADYGKTVDMMWAGSYSFLMQTYGDIQACDNPRIWAVQEVGGSW